MECMELINQLKLVHKIDTPTSERELQELYRMSLMLSRNNAFNRILDVGTYTGFSALVLALGLVNSGRDGEVITIDNYSSEVSFDSVSNLFGKYPFPIKQVNSDDCEYLSGLSNASCNIIFIDSYHEYKHVYQLLNIAVQKISKKDGLLCGHDYYWGETGVVRAVDRFRRDMAHVIMSFGVFDSIWWAIIGD